MTNMRATLVARTRIVYAENAFAELVLWKVPAPLAGSSHGFKYRLAYVVDGVCVIRYDNEVGTGLADPGGLFNVTFTRGDVSA